jgi:TolB-like protein/Flp pilus assembly protein TadD
MLLAHPGELVTHEDIRKRLWPGDTFVDFDHGLNNAVNRLRDALGDSADSPRLIETLPRRGYRFIGAISESAAPESLATSDSTGRKLRNVPYARITIAAAVILIASLTALNFRALEHHLFPNPLAFHPIRSIAVLPLENLTGDAEQESFVDGVTETLITEIAQIRSLRVISRTSSLHFKNLRLPIQEIAKQLDVDAVLEGAVLQSGSRVRITVQLIQADGDKHLWAKQYDRDGYDILNVQSEIARAVAAEIAIKLQPTEERRLVKDRPVNPDVYEAYLRGQYHWRKRTINDLNKSVEYFQQAVRLDPTSGLGYAGLAEAYAILGYGVLLALPPDEAATKARTFAAKATELDGTLATPHAVLGLIKHRHDWDWEGAEKEFQRGIELDPSSWSAHYWYANYLQSLGRSVEERSQLDLARHLDPVSVQVLTNIANNLDASGHHAEAIPFFTQAIGLDEASWIAHYDLAGSYAKFGEYEQAIREYNRTLELTNGNPRIQASLARAFALAGRKGEAGNILQQIKGKPNSAFSIAEVYIALGEKDEAFKYLQQALDEKCGWVVFMRVLSSLDPIRSDDRFEKLTARVGFPPQ